MKRLWKFISPCMSDIAGFQAIISHSEGLGVVDDSSPYKPLHYERTGTQHGNPHSAHSLSFHSEHDSMTQPTNHRMNDRAFAKSDIERLVRVFSSQIHEVDVIHGTAQKIMQAFINGNEQLEPQFVLLTTAPCAAMIGTDLGEVADKIQSEYGIPTAVVNLDGQKDYLYGMSCTLEAMGKLLLKQKDTIPNTVNLLGCNYVDWSADAVQKTEQWLTDAGFTVLSRWGVQDSTQKLKNASAASVNLVVNVAGLRLARYMEQEFNIPYVVGAPFGAEQCERLLKQLKNRNRNAEIMQSATGTPEALVIGEQMQANAIRNALLEKGFQNVQVCSFFEMDKKEMAPFDKKLVSEDELKTLLEGDSLRIVFGDSNYQQNKAISWVPLANQANVAPVLQLPPFSLVGAALNRWMDTYLS